MPVRTYAGRMVEIDEEGYFTDPATWNEAMIAEIARDEGLGELTERQLQVVRFMRQEYEEHGGGPSVRMLAKTSGVGARELYELFPKGPAKVAAKIAGIPKPKGCM